MIHDHVFAPQYAGYEEWKQLCTFELPDGRLCGGSKSRHSKVTFVPVAIDD